MAFVCIRASESVLPIGEYSDGLACFIVFIMYYQLVHCKGVALVLQADTSGNAEMPIHAALGEIRSYARFQRPDGVDPLEIAKISWIRALVASLLFMAGGGCTFLPAAGPTASQIESSDADMDVYLVRVSAPIVRALEQYRGEGFPQAFRLENHRPSIALRPGDVVSVSIYEAGGSRLFGGAGGSGEAGGTGSAASQGATLPPQTIELDGRITIPFAGRVALSGRTPGQAANEIAKQLASQTVTPQVIVSLVDNNSNAVAVGGEVNKAGLVPLTLRGERLLDVIAGAGGPRFPAAEVDVRVIRGDTVATVPLQEVLAEPADNIVVRPSDNVVLVRNPKTFVVMGAAMKVAQYNMDLERVTLAEGVARAGGTIDTVGNPAGIYVLRNEPSSVARAVLSADKSAVDASYVRTEETRQLAASHTKVLYRVDLSQAAGYFYAQNMTLRDKDIVLIANAEGTQVQKLMMLLRGVTSMYFDLSRSAGYYAPN